MEPRIQHVDETDVAPPAYNEVINSTRYPVMRSSVSSDIVLELEDTVGQVDIQGQGQVIGNGPDWRLKFVDLTPHIPPGGSSNKRHLTDFKTLVARANLWLHSNKDVNVISCETLTWKANAQSKLNDTELVNSTIKTSSKVYYMRGLRLWLVPRLENEDGVSISIGTRDFEPDLTYKAHCNLSTFLKIINNRIQEEPLPGHPISFETVVRRTSPNVRVEDTLWTEMPNETRTYAFFFRIFYIRGPPCTDYIGLQDFRPDHISGSNKKYEPFDQVIQRANEWIIGQTNINVLGIQSVLLKRKDSLHKQVTDQLHYTVHGSKPVAFHQCLRIAYKRLHPDASIHIIPSTVLSKKTFAPVKRELSEESQLPGELQYESFSRTVEQVSAWLKTSDCPVLAVETVHTRMSQGSSSYLGPECSVVWSYEKSIEHWLTHIRIYLRDQGGRAQSQEPRYLNQVWYSRRSCLSSDESDRGNNKRYIIVCSIIVTLVLLAGLTGGLLYYFSL